MPRQGKFCLGVSLGIILLLCLVELKTVLATKIAPLDVELQIGIVQRFGDEVGEEVAINSTQGDSLTLSFVGDDLQKRTLQTSQLKVAIEPQILTNSTLDERLVLSSHSAFESAEAIAEQFKKQGIETEIAQPERWQVWAKRSVYTTPLLRRLLLENLQSQGFKNVYLDSKVLTARSRLALIVGDKKFTTDSFEIKSQKNRFALVESKENSTLTLYAGSLKVQPNAYGDFSFVDLVPLETYLRGVVPFEIGADAPNNALQVQA
ncbi:MAG: SpoIID/LytB domain-containing protein, partial [Xenococcaceae cyanobacterium]